MASRQNQTLLLRAFNARWPILAEFAFVVAVVLLVRGAMIFPVTFTMDDYALNRTADLHEHFAGQMRWPTFWLCLLFEKFGGGAPFLGAMWSVLASATLVFFGMCLRVLWLPHRATIPAILSVLLFALFPYHTESLAFRMGPLAVYFVGAAIALLWLDRRGWRFSAAVAGLFLSCAYPTLLTFVVVGSLLQILIADRASANVGAMLRAALLRIALVALVLAVYIVTAKFYNMFAGVSEATRVGAFIEWGNPAAKLRLLMSQSLDILVGRSDGLPLAIKSVQLGLIVFAVVAIFLRAKADQGSVSKAVGTTLFNCMMLAVAFAAAVSVAGVFDSVAGTWNQRTLSALGIYWSGMFALAWLCSRGRMRGAVLGLGVLLAAGYALRSNEQATDFARVNMRDHMLANRIVERLSVLPKFPNLRTVVVIAGYDPSLNTARLRTVNGPMGFNVSSFVWGWSKTPLLREVSGSNWEDPSEEDEQRAKHLATGKPMWPAAGSVFIVEDIGVVVIGR